MAWLATAGGFLLVRNIDVTLKTRAFRSLNLLLKYIHAGVAMLRGTICFRPILYDVKLLHFRPYHEDLRIMAVEHNIHKETDYEFLSL